MTYFLPTLPPTILERCLAFSEQIYVMKPGTVKFEVSPSHFVFTMNQNPAKDYQNPAKDSGDSFPHPPPLYKKKKTPSDLRRNALRKAEFLKRKNSDPQAEAKNPLDTAVSNPPTTPKHEDCPKKDEPKEDSDKDVLSESTLMDTSPVDVVLQPLSPVNKARKSSVNSEIANKREIPPSISPSKSPKKETEETKDEIIHLSFCATNESEAAKKAKHNGFQNPQFLLVSNKNPNHFFYSCKVKSSIIPQIIEIMNYRENGPVQLRIVSTKKTFSPEILNHCQECQVLCRQK